VTRNALMTDIGLAVLAAIIVLIITPGLAVAAMIAILVLAACAVSLARDVRRRAQRAAPTRRPRRRT
jgi:hypothetical protein